MSQHKHKVKVALKYCGSCNPLVDSTKIARHLAQVAEKFGHFQLVPLSEEGIDVVVILCGCPRACGNKEEVRARAKQCLVTAGETLGGRPIPERCLPSAVEQELAKILRQSEDNLTENF